MGFFCLFVASLVFSISSHRCSSSSNLAAVSRATPSSPAPPTAYRDLPTTPFKFPKKNYLIFFQKKKVILPSDGDCILCLSSGAASYQKPGFSFEDDVDCTFLTQKK